MLMGIDAFGQVWNLPRDFMHQERGAAANQITVPVGGRMRVAAQRGTVGRFGYFGKGVKMHPTEAQVNKIIANVKGHSIREYIKSRLRIAGTESYTVTPADVISHMPAITRMQSIF